MHAVAEAARNVAAVGARPWAATNCLNFGNPEKPEVMWQFSEAIDGISEACRALKIPITGGNVSFYNDTLGQSIDPTPILGVLGLMEDASRALAMAFRAEGDAIVFLDGRGVAAASGARDAAAVSAASNSDAQLAEFSSSEYARTVAGIVGGRPPAMDLTAESRLIEALLTLAEQGLLASAHDLSDGGLAVAIAESVFASANGAAGSGDSFSADIAMRSESAPAELALFGEQGARAIVSAPQAKLALLQQVAAQWGVAAQVIGKVTRGPFQLSFNGAKVLSDSPASLRAIWAGAIERAVLGRAAEKP
jgi:phosphoribosylformylglycinamidine synthase